MTDSAPTVYLPDGTPVKVRLVGATCEGEVSGEGHYGYTPRDLNGEDPAVYFEEVGRKEDGESADEPGLYDKYEVRKDGEPVPNCFVLEPSDPAARGALIRYAEETDDEALAADLREWVIDYCTDSGTDHSSSDAEHPTPACPNCGGERTRPLDDEWATCFDCGDDWMMTDEVQAEVASHWDMETEDQCDCSGGTGHSHEVGDVLEKFDTSEWEITNRMIDVDTDEALYRLRDVNSDFNDTEIATESEIGRNFELSDGDHSLQPGEDRDAQ